MATVDKTNSIDFQACLCLREDNIEFEIQDWKDNIDLGKDHTAWNVYSPIPVA